MVRPKHVVNIKLPPMKLDIGGPQRRMQEHIDRSLAAIGESKRPGREDMEELAILFGDQIKKNSDPKWMVYTAWIAGPGIIVSGILITCFEKWNWLLGLVWNAIQRL